MALPYRPLEGNGLVVSKTHGEAGLIPAFSTCCSFNVQKNYSMYMELCVLVIYVA